MYFAFLVFRRKLCIHGEHLSYIFFGRRRMLCGARYCLAFALRFRVSPLALGGMAVLRGSLLWSWKPSASHSMYSGVCLLRALPRDLL